MSAALAGWLFSATGWVRRAIAAALSIVARYPWQTIALLLLAAAAWFWRREHAAIAERDTARAETAALVRASRAAAATALARHEADERHYKELADHADARHDADARLADRATLGYIALHRLRAPGAARAGGGTSAKAEGGDPGVPSIATPDADLVAVGQSDVRACAADYTYAKAAYDWATSLGQ